MKKETVKLETADLNNSINNAPSDPSTFDQEKRFVTIAEKREIEELRKERDINTARKTYTNRIYNLTIVWYLAIILILVLSGLEILKLSDTILVTLITTTTANLVGLLLVIVKFLFRNPK